MFFYAQINDDSIVVAVTNTSGEIVADNMIALNSFDISLNGKRYNRDTQEFEDVPEPAAPLTRRSCTPAQGLAALYAVKEITEDDIRAVIDGIPDPVTRYTAKIGYERATVWEEGSPTMQMMQVAFNLSDADMDELFDYAVQVNL